jgi:uracil-DNA glycosylase
VSTATASELIPARPSLKSLREAAAGCQACPLWRDATQTVFGKGRRTAKLMLVGEQPGDREDIEGEPFVGPAGGVLSTALEEAGIDPAEAYVTNVVKHFKWKPGRGKRRLHQTPNAKEVQACRPWLEVEIDLIRPELLVCLGATAAKALLGPQFRVTRDRGTVVETGYGIPATATVHPSSILRIEDPDERKLARIELARDLADAARKIDSA